MTLVVPRLLGSVLLALSAGIGLGCDSPADSGRSATQTTASPSASSAVTPSITTTVPATLTASPSTSRVRRLVVPFVEDGRYWARSLLASSTATSAPKAAVASDGSIIVGLMIGYSEGPASADFGGGVLDGVGDLDIVIGKFDANGSHRWSHRFGTAETDTLGGLALTEDGSIIVAGSTEGPLDLGGGPLAGSAERSAYIAAFDADGRQLWSRRLAGTGSSFATSPQILPGGDIAVAGTFTGTLDLDPERLEAGEQQPFVARLTRDGETQWASAIDGEIVWALRLEEATDDLVVLTGPRNHSSSVQSNVLRLSGAGEILWRAPLGPADNVFVRDLAVDQDGTILVIGAYHAPASFGGETLTPRGWDADIKPDYADAFLLRLSATGEHVWSVGFGSFLSDRADALTVVPNREIYVAGESSGTFYFGRDPEGMQRDGNAGGFIARFAPDGTPLAAMLLEGTRALGPVFVNGPATEDGEMLLGGRYFDALRFPFGGRLLTDQWFDHFLARIEAP